MRFLITFFLYTGIAFAQTPAKSNVAVMPFSGDNSVSADQLEFITSKFTGEVIRTNAFTVLDRGKMEFILKEQGFQQSGACNSSDCQMQIGQLLGVDHLISGKLVRFGGTYALHLEFINVGTGEIARTVDVEEKGDLEDVYKNICAHAAKGLQSEVLDQTQAGVEPKQVPADALPRMESKPISTKRKIAIALWGTSLVGAGAGVYLNRQGEAASEDYDDAIDKENPALTKSSYNDTQDAIRGRNVSYGAAVGTGIVGLLLWFWPEGR